MTKKQISLPAIKFTLWWPDLRGGWQEWLPSRGNVLFTLLVIGGLFWAQNVGALSLGAPLAAGSSTGTIAYQGRLADSGGTPVTNTVPMVFRLYPIASGGTPLWEEQWTGSNSVQVSDGLFNVMLGSLTPIPESVITGNSTLFLGISVGTDGEMSPRVQLGSIPFAVQALTVPDGSITTAKLADGSVTGTKLAPGTLTNLSIDQANVIANVKSVVHDVEMSVPATGYVDLVTLPLQLQEPTTLRISYQGLIWKTLAGGRTALGVRIDGDANTDTQNVSWVQVGTQPTAGWVIDSQQLSNIWFDNVAAGSHSVTLVLGSWDAGTSHARAYSMSIEVLKRP